MDMKVATRSMDSMASQLALTKRENRELKTRLQQLGEIEAQRVHVAKVLKGIHTKPLDQVTHDLQELESLFIGN